MRFIATPYILVCLSRTMQPAPHFPADEGVSPAPSLRSSFFDDEAIWYCSLVTTAFPWFRDFLFPAYMRNRFYPSDVAIEKRLVMLLGYQNDYKVQPQL